MRFPTRLTDTVCALIDRSSSLLTDWSDADVRRFAASSPSGLMEDVAAPAASRDDWRSDAERDDSWPACRRRRLCSAEAVRPGPRGRDLRTRSASPKSIISTILSRLLDEALEDPSLNVREMSGAGHNIVTGSSRRRERWRLRQPLSLTMPALHRKVSAS
jgi:hypothetical protein